MSPLFWHLKRQVKQNVTYFDTWSNNYKFKASFEKNEFIRIMSHDLPITWILMIDSDMPWLELNMAWHNHDMNISMTWQKHDHNLNETLT